MKGYNLIYHPGLVNHSKGSAKGERFIESREKGDIISVYTAIKTYKKQDKNLEIKLAGDIHFGEESYFKNMIKELNTLDKILYEGVKPAKLSLKHKFTLSYLLLRSIDHYYRSLKEILDFSFRPEVLNTILEENEKLKEKWEHCDINIKEFIEHEKSDEEKTMYAIAAFTTLISSLISKASPEIVKAQMAAIVSRGNFKFGETLVDFRNEKVKIRLDEICKTNSDYKIGIFYGAGHMPDFSEHVTDNLGFEKTDEKWYKAFDAKKLETLTSQFSDTNL